MKALFYSTIISLFIVAACNNSPSANSADNPLSQLDTSISHCYIYNEAGFEEVFQLKIIGNQITGIGNRAILATGQYFNLTIAGTISGNTADMTILAVHNHQLVPETTSYETWSFVDNQLNVSHKMYLGKQADLSYTKINCGATPAEKRDSNLYDYLGEFNEGYAVVSHNGYYGLINEKNELTIPFKYRDLEIVNENSIVFFDENVNKKGLLDPQGNVIFEAIYPEIHCFNEGLAAFLSEEKVKWGFMDREGNIVIEPIFLNLNLYDSDLHRHPFNEGLANVQTENGWSYINKKGEIVIKGDYILAKHFKNGKAEVYTNTKSFFIDKTGNCIENCD